MLTFRVDAPKSMIDFCKTTEAKEKPYNICLKCPFIRESCDGPNILALEYHRWVEWSKDWIKQHKITRQGVADAAGLPLSTINSALSGTGYDIKTDTMRRITKALVGGCWGQYPCHLAAILMDGTAEVDTGEDAKRIAALEAEVARLNAKLQKVIDTAEAKIADVKAEEKAKIDYLKEQVEGWRNESRIRDKFLSEKNETINRLVNALIEKTNRDLTEF